MQVQCSLIAALIVAAGFPAIGPSAAAQQKPIPDSVAAKIDALFAEWRTDSTPGCALGVGEAGVAIYSRGYGMSDLQNNLPINPASIFHIASISKQFAAFAIGLLAEDGKLSVDDDIRKYVPEVPDYGKRITLRHLIYHTSGLRDQWDLLGMAGWRDPEDLITEADVLDIVSRQTRPNFAPGDAWLYSNTGYTLLAVVVKRVSGKSLRQFADERIFQPLGMRDTHFHDDHTMIVKGRTSAYEPRKGGGWKISIPTFDTYGATSLFTTVGDLLKWEDNLDRGTIGGAALLREAQTSGKLNDGQPTNYGFGLTLGTFNGLKMIGHSGGDAGYRSDVIRFPDRRLAIAVFCNGGNTRPGALSRRVAGILLGPGPASATPPVPATSRNLDNLAGVYRRRNADLALTVGKNEGKLRIVDRDQTLLPVDDTLFRIDNDPTRVVFVSGRAGDVALRILGSTGGTVVYDRLPAFSADASRFSDFVGEYYSPELDFRYHVVLDQGALKIHSRKSAADKMEPIYRDAFRTSDTGVILRFDRKEGKVSGFFASTDRVWGVRFERVMK